MARQVLKVGLATLLAAGAMAAIVVAPLAAADPFPPAGNGQSASATIDDLQAKGYDVRINWTTGYDTKPLSECWVTGVNNPSHEAPTEGSFTTVYVDVACPNGDDGSGFTGGVGIGVG
ncbi:MAG: hypothetical protein ACRDUX_41140 [Mycobacterium sp.]